MQRWESGDAVSSRDSIFAVLVLVLVLMITVSVLVLFLPLLS